MRYSWLIIILAGTSLLAGPSMVDPCQVYGVIYVAPDPDRVDFFVFEESSEAFADILIFQEENQLFADRPGIWSFSDKPGLADYRIYFVEERRDSHFSIYFTDSESFAGCN